MEIKFIENYLSRNLTISYILLYFFNVVYIYIENLKNRLFVLFIMVVFINRTQVHKSSCILPSRRVGGVY